MQTVESPAQRFRHRGSPYGQAQYGASYGNYGPAPTVNSYVSPNRSHWAAGTTTVPVASALVDVDADGIADYLVTGVDLNQDGIPDALQDPEEVLEDIIEQREEELEMLARSRGYDDDAHLAEIKEIRRVHWAEIDRLRRDMLAERAAIVARECERAERRKERDMADEMNKLRAELEKYRGYANLHDELEALIIELESRKQDFQKGYDAGCKDTKASMGKECEDLKKKLAKCQKDLDDCENRCKAKATGKVAGGKGKGKVVEKEIVEVKKEVDHGGFIKIDGKGLSFNSKGAGLQFGKGKAANLGWGAGKTEVVVDTEGRTHEVEVEVELEMPSVEVELEMPSVEVELEVDVDVDVD